jgi:hypothetical protein
MSFSSGNFSDLRESMLIFAAHLLVGLFTRYGIASFQTLKSLYQEIRCAAPKALLFLSESHLILRKNGGIDVNDEKSSAAKVLSHTWLHYLMFALVLSNATPLIPLLFITATVVIISTDVLLFAVRERAPIVSAWHEKILSMNKTFIPWLEVIIGVGLIADIFTPNRSLLATFMYFSVFQRHRLAFKKTRQEILPVWSKLDAKVSPFFSNVPLLNKLYPKLREMAKKFANPEGVASNQ